MDFYGRYIEAILGKGQSEIDFFEEILQECCNYNINQVVRMKTFKHLVEMYHAFEIIQEKYDYYPKGVKYSARFIRKDTATKAFDDGINYEAPNTAGLYFIGETHFNPVTDEKYYWVKIGKASNLKNRMKSYNTHNPMLWRIDFNDEYDREEYYHIQLSRIALAKCNHNEEWYLVNKETYLEMCEKGFSYFC